MDLTAQFWARALATAKSRSVDEAQLQKLKQAQMLRSLAARSDFTEAAVQVAKLVATTSDYFHHNSTSYIQPGKLSEVERDQVEAQLGKYLKGCNEAIARLQSSASAVSASSANQSAHQLGAALVLSERLQVLSGLFDRARSKRYQQRNLKQQDAARQAQSLQAAQARLATYAPPSGAPPYSAAWSNPPGDQLQQQALEQENRALFHELEQRAQGASQAESTVRELALLNQLFSVQVVQQAEQIEVLYRQAVDATKNVEGGNVHLQKAIRLNTSARWYIFMLFMVASLGLLFLDWFSS